MISAFRSSDFQISGSAISSHKNIQEARKIIDELPGDGVFIMVYNGAIGISDCGKYVKKKKGIKMVDKSSTIVLQQNNFISKLNLHKNLFNDFSDYNREDIIKSILLPQLE